jgi:cleavage and polyadenylation specificity factor subunit 3
MNRLRLHLLRKFDEDPECKLAVYTPRNTQSVELHFRGEKTAKVVGTLAADKPSEGNLLSGILVRRNFKLHMMAPEDLQSTVCCAQTWSRARRPFSLKITRR